MYAHIYIYIYVYTCIIQYIIIYMYICICIHPIGSIGSKGSPARARTTRFGRPRRGVILRNKDALLD